MKKFLGIDLHANTGVIVVSDETGQVLYQRQRLNESVQILAPHREELQPALWSRALSAGTGS